MDEVKNPPQEEVELQPASPQAQGEVDKAKAKTPEQPIPDKQEAAPQQTLPQEPTPQETQAQQPHLVKKEEAKPKKARKAPLPHKSFIVAVITILLTIALGVGMALLLANLTRG